MARYRVFGSLLDRVFRNNLNANFEDVDADIKAQKERVDDLIIANPSPSEVQDARLGFPVLRDKLVDVDAQLADVVNDRFSRGTNLLYPYAPLVGAKADGLDASTAIQNILNSVSANGGGKVIVPSVTFRLSNPIYIPKNVLLEGNGDTSVFSVDVINYSAIYLQALYGTNKLENAGLKNVRIITTGQNTSTDMKNTAGVSIWCQVENHYSNGDTTNHTGELENITFENVTIKGFKTGVYLGKNTFVEKSYVYKGLKISGCLYGIYLDDYCEYTTISESVIQKCTHGIYDNGASNCSIVKNHIHNNAESGIYLYKTGRNTSKKLISTNHINHNKRGVWVGEGVGTVGEAISKVQINSNQIFANTWQGITFVGGIECQVNDNSFSGNGGDTIGDIYLGSATRRMMIHDNQFENKGASTKKGIDIQQPSVADASSYTYHNVKDNQFSKYTDANKIVVTRLGSLPLDTNNNIIDGVFEYWNTAGQPPVETGAGNAKANIEFKYLPQGTICVNNATADGTELWLLTKKPSSFGSNAVVFKAL